MIPTVPIVAQESDSEVRSESGIPLVACFSGDALSVLDSASDLALHRAFSERRRVERVTWPCPCRACSPKGVVVSVQPKGPTMYEIARCVFEHRLRGEYVTDEAARNLLLAEVAA